MCDLIPLLQVEGPPLTFSWDFDTFPLFSRSRAEKPYQMDLSSSERRSMSATALFSDFLLCESSSSLCCWHGPQGDGKTHTCSAVVGKGDEIYYPAGSDTCWESGVTACDLGLIVEKQTHLQIAWHKQINKQIKASGHFYCDGVTCLRDRHIIFWKYILFTNVVCFPFLIMSPNVFFPIYSVNPVKKEAELLSKSFLAPKTKMLVFD